MSYLIDANVLLELRRKRPDDRVVDWIEARPRQARYLSVLTLGEIRRGIDCWDDATRCQKLLDWLEDDAAQSSQLSAPPVRYSVGRVSKKFFSLRIETCSDIHGKRCSAPS